MKIGIPKGLLYSKFHVFAETFFNCLGEEIIVSPDTNKEILDSGVNLCVDDACLPVKVYHGHVAWLRDKCDYILVPRFMTMEKKKYICPMFCGLPEMIINSIRDLPGVISEPVYSLDKNEVYNWSVRSLLMDIARHKPAFHSLIDTGALITGFDNREVAEFLLDNGLEEMEGVVYLDANDNQMILLRTGGAPIPASQCGVAPSKRFSFSSLPACREPKRARLTPTDLARRCESIRTSRGVSTAKAARGASIIESWTGLHAILYLSFLAGDHRPKWVCIGQDQRPG
jgi:hypothetical protein